MQVPRQERIFQLNLPFMAPLPPKISNITEDTLCRLSGLAHLESLYARLPKDAGVVTFLDSVLEEMNVTLKYSAKDLARVPKDGPCVVVANHPFGALEGIILASILLRVRPDVKIMANYILSRIPELRDLFMFVDPFNTDQSVGKNLKPLRDSIRWVKDGGLLAVFPAGEVAHLDLKSRSVIDPEWNPLVTWITEKTRAAVTTVFFGGGNGPLFQSMGLIHPRLRTALLPRQLVKRQGKEVALRLGGPISYRVLSNYPDLHEKTDYLRWRTYALRQSVERQRVPKVLKFKTRKREEAPEPIAPPQPDELLRADVAALPPEQTMVESGDFKVFYARGQQIPNLLKEIGRLREVSFRKVGEGTGQALDLDRYDDYYIHLCLWNKVEDEIAGGYRLGLVDEIIEQQGVSGLYTASLFKFKRGFFKKAYPAVELGRSFVREKYQRTYSALMLLWKGIGRFVMSMPRYRYILGPVSMSADYSPLSRRLTRDFLSMRYRSELSHLAQARNPGKFPPQKGVDHELFLSKLKNIDELSDVIADVEESGLGIPILIKQYLKLEAKMVACNVDPDFGDALDFLLVSDLMQNDEKTIGRFLGEKAFRAFRELHSSGGPLPPSRPV